MVHQQGNVDVFRHGIPQAPQEVNLPGRGGKNVPTTHHLGDAGEGVIHHRCQLIPPQAVRALQNEVAAVPG